MSPSLDRAWQLYRFRRYPAALQEAMEFLAVSPESANAHCLIALVHAKEKRKDKAIEAAKAAISYSPDWDYTHYVLALVHYWFDGYFLSLHSLSEALRLLPTNADYYELLSSIHYEMGHYQTSRDTAYQGLEHQPEHVGCLYRAGVAQFDLKKKSEARECFEEVLRLEPEHASSQGFIGCYLVEEGKYQQALPGLQLALRDNPQWQFMQKAWREALRGTYPLYGNVATVKNWVNQRFILVTILLCPVLSALFIWMLMPLGGLDEALAIILLGIFFGVALTAGLLLSFSLVLMIYLHVVSSIILLRDRELRQTFSWKEMFIKHRDNILWVLFLLLGLLVAMFSKGK